MDCWHWFKLTVFQLGLFFVHWAVCFSLFNLGKRLSNTACYNNILWHRNHFRRQVLFFALFIMLKMDTLELDFLWVVVMRSSGLQAHNSGMGYHSRKFVSTWYVRIILYFTQLFAPAIQLSPFASRYLRPRERFPVTWNAFVYPCLLGDRTWHQRKGWSAMGGCLNGSSWSQGAGCRPVFKIHVFWYGLGDSSLFNSVWGFKFQTKLLLG